MRVRRLVVTAALLALVTSACIEPRDVGELPRCGNQLCDRTADERSDGGPETPATCPQDCLLRVCGNGVCEVGEPSLCAEDCPPTVCGDGKCDAGEDPYRCDIDCPWFQCGNHACEPTERTDTCPGDCWPGHCGNGMCEDFETSVGCPADCPPTRAVDLLFVIDNSESMAEAQWRLRRDFPMLLQQLRGIHAGLPDLHIGVISTDLGTGLFSECGTGDGDGGRLLVSPEAAAYVQGPAPYLIDVVPQGCSVNRETDGSCGEHDCLPQHCLHESDTTLVVDPGNGCPRCRNFGASAEETFEALAALGTVGCRFEQPLEAMYQALDANAHNAGFVRSEAILAIVFLTDEDDCSANDPQLFNPEQFDIHSPLGPPTSFRCFEFGVTCDVNLRTYQGVRHSCTPRIDPNRKLYRISRYTDELIWREDKLGKDPGQVVVSVFTGPVVADQVEVGADEQQLPMLLSSCSSADSSAVPAVRLRAFASHFNDPWAMRDHGAPDLCADNYLGALRNLGVALRSRLAF